MVCNTVVNIKYKYVILILQTFGKFLKNVTGSKNIDRARKYAMMGIGIHNLLLIVRV